MFITNITENVTTIIEELEQMNDIQKNKFLIYLFERLYNGQINDLNETNPLLHENDDILIFHLSLIGCSCEYVLLSNFLDDYNKKSEKVAFESSGHVLGINYSKNEKSLHSKYEKLLFKDKLDLLSEIFIKCGNSTFFKDQSYLEKIEIDGYEIARLIQNYKNKLR